MTKEKSPDEARRRYPRIEIDGGLNVYDFTASEWVELRNMSAGGFQTLSRSRVDVGDKHSFSAQVRRTEVHFRATAVYCRPASATRTSGWFVGWRSLDDRETREGLAKLIAFVTGLEFLATRQAVPPFVPARTPTASK